MTAISSEHVDVGAYALGLLEDQDKAAFESHLATCDICRAELSTLSPLGDLLRGLDPVSAPGDTEPPVSLLRRRAAASRRRLRWQILVAAAACAALLGGGIGLGLATAPSNGAVAQGLTGVRHSATNPSNGVAGTVGLVAKGWGTQVWLDLGGVRGPLECQLVAVSKTGERRVVTGWFVAPPGDGVPGHPAHLLVQGGTSIAMSNLASFEVTVVSGGTLLTIPL
jgi:hypothetical protein